VPFFAAMGGSFRGRIVDQGAGECHWSRILGTLRMLHHREERLSGYVLETGRVVLDGPRDALLADTRVQHAYLGG